MKNLSISNNNLKVLENQIFEPILWLEFLDLSTNFLTSFSIAKFGDVTDLITLDISKNNIEVMSTNFTSFFPPSTVINMDCSNCQENSKISCIFQYFSNSIYECVIRQALVLDPWVDYFIDGTHIGNDDSSDVTAISARSDSHLAFLPAVIFREFPNLQILNFVRVKITFLEEFFNCRDFRVVNLQGNLISSIFKELFLDCPKIEVLNFENNLILKLSGDSFSKLPNLNNLSLAENDIQMLYSNIFDENKNLKVLRLNSNKIVEFDEKIFFMLRDLRILTIHTNLIFELEENLLSKLLSIEEFEMQNLKLNSTISDKIFENNLNLKKLIMMKNNLTKIEEKLF